MSQNNLMMQYLADLLQVQVERPVIQETTVMGAAFLAGFNLEFIKVLMNLKIYGKLIEFLSLSRKDKVMKNMIIG
jgi:glycerol kinase